MRRRDCALRGICRSDSSRRAPNRRRTGSSSVRREILRCAQDDASSPDASLFPEAHDGGIVEVFLRAAFHVVIRFAGGGGGRQGNAEQIGEIERQAEILVHESQREAGCVFTFYEHGRFYIED